MGGILGWDCHGMFETESRKSAVQTELSCSCLKTLADKKCFAKWFANKGSQTSVGGPGGPAMSCSENFSSAVAKSRPVASAEISASAKHNTHKRAVGKCVQ